MNTHFIRVDDKQYGPFSRHELRGLARKGKFNTADYVWHHDNSEWVHAEQLKELRSIFSDDLPHELSENKVIAIGGGKGGVGKSVFSSALGIALASLDREVVLVDADLGGANLHTMMGILEPEYTFFDFYTLNRESLNDIALETPIEKLRLISGACGTLGLANPKYSQKLRFIRELRSVEAEYILLDLGAGSSYNVIDFFLAADEGIVVTNPDPTSVQECFNFIKICLMRKLKRAFHGNKQVIDLLERDEVTRPGRMKMPMPTVLEEVRKIDERAGDFFQQVLESFRPKLVVNMLINPEDTREGVAIQSAAADLLGIDVEYLGYISFDENVRDSVRELKPFLLRDSKSKASRDMAKLVQSKLLGKSMFSSLWQKRKMQKVLEQEKNIYPDLKLAEKAPICSLKCFYWNDCEYQNGGHPCTIRHLEPIFKL
ncbi:MAG: P-loop NTPase [Deferribacteres bacterium]|nr:P-loop NTPase [candidate division KSB1 bacterium]MCB9504441.1 P-loop NTPase [Deferribacteres bacterium]